LIGLIFKLGSEIVEIRVEKNNILFRNNQTNGMFTTIDGLQLNKQGVIKEHPDLKDNDNWQNIARERFKEKIKKIDTEMERADYIIEDLKKFGYKPIARQRKGFRVEKFKNGGL